MSMARSSLWADSECESTRVDIDNIGECFPDRTPKGPATPTVPAVVPAEVRNKWYKPQTIDDINYTYRKLADSPVGLLLRGIFLIIPIFMIYAGYQNRGNCPLRKEIPYWSIVIGALWIVKSMKFFIFRESLGQDHYSCRFITLIYTYVVCFWFICGSAWVYGKIEYWDYKDVHSPAYCNPILLIPALVIITFIYSVVLVILFVFRYTYIGDENND